MKSSIKAKGSQQRELRTIGMGPRCENFNTVTRASRHGKLFRRGTVLRQTQFSTKRVSPGHNALDVEDAVLELARLCSSSGTLEEATSEIMTAMSSHVKNAAATTPPGKPHQGLAPKTLNA